MHGQCQLGGIYFFFFHRKKDMHHKVRNARFTERFQEETMMRGNLVSSFISPMLARAYNFHFFFVTFVIVAIFNIQDPSIHPFLSPFLSCLYILYHSKQMRPGAVWRMLERVCVCLCA